MSINSANIHTEADWKETVAAISKFMEEKGFMSIVPEEHIPELSGIDYHSTDEKNLRFFIITRNINGWTGIFEDGEIHAEKELAQYVSLALNKKVVWSVFSGSTCNYLYTIFEGGEITDELARGDAYDYDDSGQLKYFEFYSEDTMDEFLKNQGITTPSITYEEIMRNLSGLNLTKDDLIHLAFKRKNIIPKEIYIQEDIFDEEEEEKSGFFQKMMDRITQPIMGRLEKEVGKLMPQLQKAQEMQALLKPLMEQGLKGEELRAHPQYQKLLELEKEIQEEFKSSPYYSEEMENMMGQGAFTSKLLKAYDPLEEEINYLNSLEKTNLFNLAKSVKKIMELSSGVKIDTSSKSIKRIDRAISWSGIPKKADPEKFKIATGALIGEIILKNMAGEWIKDESSEEYILKIDDKNINPFEWYEEKINTEKKLFFYEEFKKLM